MTWLKEIKERWAKATPGPWRACTWDPMERPHVHKDVDGQNCSHRGDLPITADDAVAIAHAPADIARLLKELEEAVELIDALTDAEPCSYLPGGACKVHLTGGPDCANERALVWLERVAGR